MNSMQDLCKHIFPGEDRKVTLELLNTVDISIINLPEENRIAITLHLKENLSRKEIAKQLGWSVSKANTKITRGFSLLRRDLNPKFSRHQAS